MQRHRVRRSPASKLAGYGYEARLRGLTEPALAGFVHVAGGFSHPVNG